LLPNNSSGKHWKSTRKVKDDYRDACYWLAKNWAKKNTPPKTQVRIDIIFHPPDKRPRDIDNMLSSIKHGIDGIALAWDVNDKIFRPMFLDIGEPVKNGAVKIIPHV